jgi:hypothetical protein
LLSSSFLFRVIIVHSNRNKKKLRTKQLFWTTVHPLKSHFFCLINSVERERAMIPEQYIFICVNVCWGFSRKKKYNVTSLYIYGSLRLSERKKWIWTIQKKIDEHSDWKCTYSFLQHTWIDFKRVSTPIYKYFVWIFESPTMWSAVFICKYLNFLSSSLWLAIEITWNLFSFWCQRLIQQMKNSNNTLSHFVQISYVTNTEDKFERFFFVWKYGVKTLALVSVAVWTWPV